MYYVYLMFSISMPDQRYTGYTADLKRRIGAHNAGQSKYTAKYAPWRLVCYHAFADKQVAQRFEAYLKTGSGQAFAKRHFWSD